MKRDGFTLLEVLVSLAISALILFLAFAVNSRSIDSVRESRRDITLLSIAEDLLIEETAGFPDLGKKSGEITEPGFSGTYTVTVRETPHPDAREVVITVVAGEEGQRRITEIHGVAIR
ncbi:MAG: prepilin-type N-terminal cleavage/methylation domain-containing protein [Deltaproteobacteria bacterium]|nr:MAG: prepilin-type N-terminal cleavage/methylation domain-containing protein [Deltaproteobacteria bacterium]